MPSPHNLVLVSVLLNCFAAYAYIWDTWRGTTTPNIVSWTMWALAPLIGTGAAISAGADIWAVIRVFLAGFLPLLVVISSFVNPHCVWRFSTFDFLCGAASLMALVLWLFLEDPVSAVLVAVLGDALASIPTLIKAWRAPETETGRAYAASFISALLVIPSIPAWDIPNSAFPIYLLTVNLLLTALVWRQITLERINTITTLN